MTHFDQPTHPPIFDNTISATDLDQLIANDHRLRIFDCRAKLGEPAWAAQAFHAGHLPGAQQLDLDRDLATNPGPGGRHPLPAQSQWLETLRDAGLSNDEQVIVYDDAGGAYAARAWWMLRWVGHRAVAVLDGGLSAWTAAPINGALSTASPSVDRSNFLAAPSLTRQCDLRQMAAELDGLTLVDARAHERWSGSVEPIDAVAGHIPGAICMPFQDNLEAGRFKTPAQLQERFAQVARQDAVFYCGSGVTACHNILACHIAGLPEPALFAPSWSGWITDPDRPIER